MRQKIIPLRGLHSVCVFFRFIIAHHINNGENVIERICNYASCILSAKQSYHCSKFRLLKKQRPNCQNLFGICQISMLALFVQRSYSICSTEFRSKFAVGGCDQMTISRLNAKFKLHFILLFLSQQEN